MYLRRLITAVAALAVVVPAAPSAGANLGFRGIGGELAQDLSGDGSTVAGWDSSTSRAWRWSVEGGKVLLPLLHSDTVGAIPWGLSFDGSVIAGHSDRSSGGRFTVAWTPSGPVTFGPGRLWGGVSADGTVFSGDRSYDNGGPVDATRWTMRTDGTVGLQRLSFTTAQTGGMSSDGRVVVGGSAGPVRWVGDSGTMEHLGLLPGTTGGIANAASGDGSVVVGFASDSASATLHDLKSRVGTGCPRSLDLATTVVRML